METLLRYVSVECITLLLLCNKQSCYDLKPKFNGFEPNPQIHMLIRSGSLDQVLWLTPVIPATQEV
jgi:hypothetical protein